MRRAMAAAAAAAFALAAPVAADETQTSYTVDGTEVTVRAEAPDDHPLPVIRSGWTFRTSETQQVQTDDFMNSAMIFIDQARDQWETVEGSEGKSCASCHGDVEESMEGLRAGMPKYNEKAGSLYTLEDYINECRTERMGAEAWKWDKPTMNAMKALIGLQSRGMPVDVDIDGPAREWWERGKEMYYTRYGQLELSCANCHEQNYDNYIRADHLSQGQINGFPTYRLKNTRLNSIQGRFKGCIRDTRAETFSPGSDEFRALQLYVAWRGEGLDVETPAVRN
ncbi:MAG: sulfur oxidation c-type cytochrome SoxA [Pseudomonadota bacterium]